MHSRPPSRDGISRRRFLGVLGSAAAFPFVASDMLAVPPSSVLRHASFGASGMAASDIASLTANKFVKLVAVAEVDLNRVGNLPKRFPGLRVYQDWRKLLEKEAKNIDSVNVTVPDHMHAPIGMSAIQLGKHVYGQKPLTHDIYETRRLTEAAREKGVVTQMGIQIHSTRVYRTAVKIIQDGTIGKIREVHTWSNKKWGDPNPRPNRVDPVPKGFNWDLWLGVAAWRPFIGKGYYHPANWRKRLDFGTGTFGDMGCHIFDPVFSALELTAPLTVRSEGPPPNAHNWALNDVIHYVFPGTRHTAGKTVRITWYDGDARPPKEVQSLLEGDNMPGQGSIFIGTEGAMLLPHIATAQLYPYSKYKDFRMPKVTTANHWTQFAEACVGKGKTWASFDYAGPLTESVLLGSVACRFPHTTLEWDAKNLRFKNVSEANAYIRRRYRAGWEIEGL
ncbi:MAG: Gfo/Idh/MocA family oxidoreductase [Verrucomicrobia bacterium]|nr:Gfo/Idh/MocA family oxidoreductase [Verrucomicrobiota bacterium]